MKKRLGEQVTATLEPVNILDRIIAETKLTPQDEAYDIAKRGVSAFIEELLKSKSSAEPVKKALVDRGY
jgi:type VI secretion system protein ImpC